MNNIFLNSTTLGVVISLSAYYLGVFLKNKTKKAFVNPSLLQLELDLLTYQKMRQANHILVCFDAFILYFNFLIHFEVPIPGLSSPPVLTESIHLSMLE